MGRDPFGIRSLYIGKSNVSVSICSELKGINNLCDIVEPFPPGQICEITVEKINTINIFSNEKFITNYTKYYNYEYVNKYKNDEIIMKNIYDKLDYAV